MRKAYLIIGLLVIFTLPVLGASSYLGGFSGVIITPDDTVVPVQTWEASFHDTLDIFDGNDSDLMTIGLTYGLLSNLEVGASLIDDGSSQIAISGKYRLVTEKSNSPSVTVGVFDIAGSANSISSDPSFYIMVSKNITPLASDIVDRPSKPLQLGIGVGSGLYNGIIANLNWTLEPNLSLLAEYNGGNDGPRGLRNRPSAGVRWAVSDTVRLDVAAVGFRDLGFGINFRSKY
ncbi:MAG: hypothetical protein ACYC0V_06615 [Armatimonadota bacterium]